MYVSCIYERITSPIEIFEPALEYYHYVLSSIHPMSRWHKTGEVIKDIPFLLGDLFFSVEYDISHCHAHKTKTAGVNESD